MGVPEDIAAALGDQGLPEEISAKVLAAVDAAGFNLQDKISEDPVESIDATTGECLRVTGLPGLFVWGVDLGENGVLVWTERTLKSGGLERTEPVVVSGAATLLTAAEGGGGAAATTVAKVVDADQSIDTQTALQDITDLAFAIAAGETWVYEGTLRLGAAMETTGFKFGVSVPSGATIVFRVHAIAEGWAYPAGVHVVSTGSAADFGAFTPSGGAGDNDNQIVRVEATVVNSSTAGTVQFRFAQSVSDAADLTVKAKSYLVGHKAS